MIRRILFPALLVAGIVGCGRKGEPRPDPVKVSATVQFADGKPVKDVNLTLFPQGGGLPGSFKIVDGKVELESIPGPYLYTLTAIDGKEASLKAIPEKYFSNDEAQQLTVAEGQSISIKLDPR